LVKVPSNSVEYIKSYEFFKFYLGGSSAHKGSLARRPNYHRERVDVYGRVEDLGEPVIRSIQSFLIRVIENKL